MMQIISATDAVRLVQDRWTVVPGGFGSCGHPELLTRTLAARYREEGMPRDLTLLFASASGDRSGRGVDALAQKGLVRRAIGGFWGLVPALGNMAIRGEIEAHNWPQGVVSQLYRAIAARKPGIFSKIGMHTFVDPDVDGARLNSKANKPLVQKIDVNGIPMLFYPSIGVDCVLLRGTCSDPQGNISMDREVSYSDALAQAMAAKNNGGIVIVQVEQLVKRHAIEPHDVCIPGILVDYVVVAEPSDHPQTYGDAYNPAFTTAGEGRPPVESLSCAESIIIRRALQEIRKRDARVINLGIGIPALIGQFARGFDDTHSLTLTVESGQIGGSPATGLSFGASHHPNAVLEQSALFDFYEGGGLDLSCLGFAEVDAFGNVNVSRFGDRLYGAGGFINISQSTDVLLFCGTFTADGIQVEYRDGGIRIAREGRVRKFVRNVSHLTFSGAYSQERRQTVRFITERAVFSLKDGVVHLDEVAPGISIEDDIIPNMEGSFVISADCRLMDRSLFTMEELIT